MASESDQEFLGDSFAEESQIPPEEVDNNHEEAQDDPEQIQNLQIQNLFAKIEEVFAREGKLNRLFPDYEYRPQQREMAGYVAERLTEGESALVEAGTGVGKSLAYLIPLLFWSRAGYRTAISTQTKGLQEQILTKDLPLARKLHLDARVEVAYGAGNYLCLRKLHSQIDKGGFFPEEEEQYHNLQVWARTSDSGLRHKVPFYISPKVWENVRREGDNTLNKNCPFYEKCFYHRARKKWHQADIVVLNHSLFFANIASQGKLLPRFDVALFDEAHSLENIVSEQFSFALSYKNLKQIIAIFYDGKKSHNLEPLSSEKNKQFLEEELAELGNRSLAFFEAMADQANERPFRLSAAPGVGEQLQKSLEDMVAVLERDLEKVKKEKGQGEIPEEYLPFQMGTQRLSEWTTSLREFLALADSKKVYWLEEIPSEELSPGTHIQLRGAPIDIGGIMTPLIVENIMSAFFVSATLSVAGNFQYSRQRLGLPKEVGELSLSSPFDYQKQVILYTTPHVADPNHQQEKYVEHLVYIITRLARITGGYLFLLFTSYRVLHQVHEGLESLGEEGFTLVEQDNRPTGIILEEYLSSNKPLLCGTSSFWQGVDVPGDELRGVVITRLPFTVPTDPVNKARVEKLEKNGQNPFMSFSVPEAAIKLKQGFGRLVRRTSDRGIVAILDSRLHKKQYGNLLLKALPPSRHLQKLDLVAQEFAAMFGGEEGS